MTKPKTLMVAGSQHSRAYAEIVNLINMVDCHRKLCSDPDCGVALFFAKGTAERLIPFCWSNEKADVVLKIINTRWS